MVAVRYDASRKVEKATLSGLFYVQLLVSDSATNAPMCLAAAMGYCMWGPCPAFGKLSSTGNTGFSGASPSCSAAQAVGTCGRIQSLSCWYDSWLPHQAHPFTLPGASPNFLTFC